LDRLKPVKAAFFDHTEAAPACLEGTRVELLSNITAWMKNSFGQKIYWLSGAAGTGKTTVAQSVAKVANEMGLLCASFFFSRTADDRGNYASVIPTLAYQLAIDERYRSRVCAAVAADGDIQTRPLQLQVQKLLLEVLQPLVSNPQKTFIIVLDALDESRVNVNKVHGGDLLPVLVAAMKDVPFAKIFLTSRPESSIERIFAHEHVGDDTFPLVLHRDIPKDTVQADIERYLRDEFTKIRQMANLGGEFPPESDIRSLIKRADGLFIYARTVVEYIRDPDGSPDYRLTALLESKPGTTSEQYERLDELYAYILEKALRITPGKRHDADLRNTLVTLVLLQEQLPLTALATFANVNKHKCVEFLQRISAVLNNKPGSTEPIRLVHASFPDFLSDPARCTQLSEYGVKFVEDNLWMAERCLEQLNSGLRYDICRIGDPSLLNAEVLDLRTRIDQHISLVLRYACRFWAVHWLAHLRAAGSSSRIPQGLEKFCAKHLLHWIEVLSLAGDFYFVQEAISELTNVINVRVTVL
jgi:hypothetical protein